MTFLAPGFLIAAVAAAAALVVAHLIAWRQPPDVTLPTARFVPEASARSTARAVSFSDAALLGLRVAVLLLAGAGLAHPRAAPVDRGPALLVAADLSGDAAVVGEVLDSVEALERAGQAMTVIGFDTVARPIREWDLGQETERRTPGAVSTALVALRREATSLARVHRRVDIAIVSPFLAHEFDAATLPLRALIPESIRVVRVRAVREAPDAGELEIRATGDDPVAAGIRLARANGLIAASRTARVVRGALTGEDSAWAATGGHLVLWWPADTQAAGESGAASTLAGVATIARGVATKEATLLGFVHPTGAPRGRPIAFWLDGQPAAGEVTLGEGCLRHAAFEVPVAGDLALTSSFQRLAGDLLRPCRAVGGAPAADSLLALLAASPATDVASRTPTDRNESNRVGAILLLLAIAAGAMEMLVRRRRSLRAGQDGVATQEMA